MDITDIPPDAHTGDESLLDFDELESADSLVKSRPTCKRLLDIVTGLRIPPRCPTSPTSLIAMPRQPATI